MDGAWGIRKVQCIYKGGGVKGLRDFMAIEHIHVHARLHSLASVSNTQVALHIHTSQLRNRQRCNLECNRLATQPQHAPLHPRSGLVRDDVIDHQPTSNDHNVSMQTTFQERASTASRSLDRGAFFTGRRKSNRASALAHASKEPCGRPAPGRVWPVRT